MIRCNLHAASKSSCAFNVCCVRLLSHKYATNYRGRTYYVPVYYL